VILSGKRLLVTGVLTRRSIAFEAARQAQELGAEVILTSFGRPMSISRRSATQLPRPAEVLELDVNDPQHLEALPGHVGERWGGLDGILHAIAFSPADATNGDFLAAPLPSVETAFRTSAYSLKAIVEALREPLAQSGRASVVALDFDAQVAWPSYNWMGVSKAALEAIARYLARDLGPEGVRVNLVSSGPIRTTAASGVDGFEPLVRFWEAQAPLGWDANDAGAVAGAVCFLLSDLARGITGEILRVDGGYHAMGAPLRPIELPS
jgi:enoyl ACP reductase